MGQNRPLNIRMMVFASLFTALIIVGGYLSFPLPVSPVPIVLSDFFMMVAGLFLGTSWGLASVGMFVFLGAVGLPVFAGGKGGPAVLAGPTGGFLCGYLAGVAVIGWISHRGKPTWVKDLAALIAGNVLLFGLGVTWLKIAVLKTTWLQAVLIGFLPYLPGLAIKTIAAIAAVGYIRRLTDGGAAEDWTSDRNRP